MEFAVGVIVFIIGLALSIALHEIGHLAPAKRFGVRVPQYMVGFGPTIWSRVRGETEYGLKAIPLGGYIRMIGMFPPRNPAAPELTGRYANMMEEARAQALEEVTPFDRHRTFYGLSTGKKLTVMLGGPFMNLVLATVIMSINFVGIGTWAPTATVAQVVVCTPTTSNPNGLPSADGTCVGSAPTAAYSAGMLPGVTIERIGTSSIETWDDLAAAIESADDVPVEVEFVRSTGERVIKQVQITEAQLETETGEWVNQRFLGISPEIALVSEPFSAIPAIVWSDVSRAAVSLLSFPIDILNLTLSLFSGEPRSDDSPVSVLGIGRFSGELAANDDFLLIEKISYSLFLLGSLNIFMFVFNLVPLLPLDGGHVAGALFEGMRRTNARLRRLPRPWPSDTTRMLPLAHVVTLVLVTMSLIVIVADIVKPITLN